MSEREMMQCSSCGRLYPMTHWLVKKGIREVRCGEGDDRGHEWARLYPVMVSTRNVSHPPEG